MGGCAVATQSSWTDWADAGVHVIWLFGGDLVQSGGSVPTSPYAARVYSGEIFRPETPQVHTLSQALETAFAQLSDPFP